MMPHNVIRDYEKKNGRIHYSIVKTDDSSKGLAKLFFLAYHDNTIIYRYCYYSRRSRLKNRLLEMIEHPYSTSTVYNYPDYMDSRNFDEYTFVRVPYNTLAFMYSCEYAAHDSYVLSRLNERAELTFMGFFCMTFWSVLYNTFNFLYLALRPMELLIAKIKAKKNNYKMKIGRIKKFTTIKRV
jgi:hypothetical protein